MSSSGSGKSRRSQSQTRPSIGRHHSRLSLQKKRVSINIYDLWPEGRVSYMLWGVGCSFLHSGVVIGDKEYAFGGHDRPGATGVYWTRPQLEPPGGRFRCEIVHGFSIRSDKEIQEIIREASEMFLGPTYNLLSRNCNHFTSHICEALTSQPAPAWLNRAASIGKALPCLVPREWVTPPDYDSENEDEESRMLPPENRRISFGDDPSGRNDWDERSISSHHELRDTSGRKVPVSERAPVALDDD